MRYSALFILAIVCSGCSYFNTQEIVLLPTIERFESTPNGLVVYFDPQTDQTIDHSGVEYREPGDFFSPFRQVVQDGRGGDSIIVPNLNDGTYEFRAFLTSEDFYGYGPVVASEVTNIVPEAPCLPALNSTRTNALGINCGNGQASVSSSAEPNLYTITVRCSTSSTRFIFAFPQKPRSGIYLTTGQLPDRFDRRPNIVSVSAISNVQSPFDRDQSVFVENINGQITLTICGIRYPFGNTSGIVVTGRYRE